MECGVSTQGACDISTSEVSVAAKLGAYPNQVVPCSVHTALLEALSPDKLKCWVLDMPYDLLVLLFSV